MENRSVAIMTKPQVAVQRTPHDVLTLIFAFAAGVWRGGNGVNPNSCSRYLRPDYKSLLTFTMVCKDWHEAAITVRSFWTYISSIFEPGLNELLLRRSSPFSSLMVELAHESIGRGTSLFDRIAPIMSRVEYLKVQSVDPLFASHALFQQTAPLLVALEVFDLDFVDLALFGSNTPKLKSVTLHATSLNWNSSLLSNLTHLSIANLAGKQCIPLPTLLAVLRSSPSLDSFELFEADLTYSVDEIQRLWRQSRVLLSHLRRCRLEYVELEKPYASYSVLQFIEAPALLDLTMAFRDIHSIIVESVDSLLPNQFLSESFLGFPPETLALTVSLGALNINIVGRNAFGKYEQFHLYIGDFTYARSEHCWTILRSIIPRWSLSTAETMKLIVMSSPSNPSVTWTRSMEYAISDLPNLTTLHLQKSRSSTRHGDSDHIAEYVLDFLMANVDGHMLFLYLKHIVVEEIPFLISKSSHISTALGRFLQHRKDSGRMLSTLQFVRCPHLDRQLANDQFRSYCLRLLIE